MILFCLLIACISQHRLTGTLHNDEGQPLKGAKIKIEDLNIVSYSNGNGDFSLPDKAYDGQRFTSQHSVVITHVGYEPKTLEVSFKKNNKVGTIVLSPIEINVPYRKKNLLLKEK